MLALSHILDRIRFMHEFHSSRSDQILFSCHPQFWAGCETQGESCPCFHSLSPTIYIRSRSQPFPFDPHCRPFPTTRISPAKEFIVCIRPELFCRPFPTVNSLKQAHCIRIRYEIPFATPCAIYARKCIAVKHFAGYRKCLSRLRFPPSLLPLMPSLTVTLCFHKGEHFPDDAALPQLRGRNRADTSDLSTRYASLTALIYCQGPSIPSDEQALFSHPIPMYSDRLSGRFGTPCTLR
eukprot:TRINITY_DN1346_c0_g4_i1.p1 TRINITY_DN1346_c0_g4~~TRINITY_DN1346_c0_g4_i1.p1  ORF type:complete len:237 (+),score=-61.57 TRINITY_DN1346_c0_g4_i1:645-1355(+)